MIHLKFSPEWFNLPSLTIDFFSFIVLLIISLVSLKYYRINKSNRKYYYLSFSFFLICLSFLFKFLTNITVYYDIIARPTTQSVVFTTLDTIRDFNIFSNITFAAFAFLNLIGLYYLYSIYQSNQSKSSIFLLIL